MSYQLSANVREGNQERRYSTYTRSPYANRICHSMVYKIFDNSRHSTKMFWE